MDTSALPSYVAEPVQEDGTLVDVRITIAGKTWHMWGRNGRDRELALADGVPPGTLPVLLGAGLGHCLKRLAAKGPVAVVDREEPIRKLTNQDDSPHGNVTLINAQNPEGALHELRQWQAENGGAAFHPVRLSLYQRLAPNFYGLLGKTLDTEKQADFWTQTRYPRFRNVKPRILFFKADYFLSDEILNALDRMGVAHDTFPVETGGLAGSKYVEELLGRILEFKPDFVLTVNHFGLDREGKITGLLEKMHLPLASWFVDNPHLILYRYRGLDAANVILFSFDAFKLDILREKGFRQVHYLPLATDPYRFRPGALPRAAEWNSRVSFVGNSMTAAVNRTLKAAHPSPLLRMQYTAIAAAYGESSETSVARFIDSNYPELAEEISKAESIERQLALESLITWESTRQYRLECVRRTLGHSPLIVGDEAWKRQLPDNGSWRHHPPLNYYGELPAFYPCSEVNFNCTSLQMKGAVNQRVFDVPACGGFLLTDYRQQMEELFEPDSEVAIYNDVKEIPERLDLFLSDENKRRAISEKARKRVLAHHTYVHRLESLCRTMREHFS